MVKAEPNSEITQWIRKRVCVTILILQANNASLANYTSTTAYVFRYMQF